MEFWRILQGIYGDGSAICDTLVLAEDTKRKAWPGDGRHQAEGEEIFSRIYKFPGRLKLSLLIRGFCWKAENSQVATRLS